MPFIPDAPAKSGFVPDENQPPANPVAAIGNTPNALPEGATPDNPSTGDLFGSDISRTKSSFGDPAGVKNMLMQRGFKDARQNKNGDVVAQSPNDNKWYKDEQGLTHPVNWLEGHAGSALPTAGMAVGGVMGGAGGTALGGMTGPAAPAAAPALGYAGAVAGAGAGGGAGEAARVGLGKILGVNQGDVVPQMKNEAENSAIAEGVGKPVGEAVAAIPGVKQAGNWVADRTVRPALAKLSQLASLGGTNYEAAMRLLQRPTQVLGSTAEGQVAKTADQGAAELAAATKAQSDAYDLAQQKFFRNSPPMIPTNNAVGAIDQTLARPGYRPNSSGYGAFDADGVSDLQRMKRSFQTPRPSVWQMGEGGAPPPGAPPMPGGAAPRPDIEVGRAIVPQGGDLSVNSPGTQNRTNPLAMDNNGPGTGATGGDDFIGMNRTGGGITNQQSPQELAGNLQYLRQASKPGSYTEKGVQKFRADADAGVNKAVLGGLKQDLYGAGDAGFEFGAANDKFSNFADDAELLKGLENPSQAENWANSFSRKGKTAVQAAAERTIPQTYEKLADIGAYNSFGNDGTKAFLGPTGRAVALFGAGEGMNMMSGNPLGFMGHAALGTWAATSHPAVQRALLGLAGKAINQQAGPVAVKALNPWVMNQGSQ